jgi:hypothetical protein
MATPWFDYLFIPIEELERLAERVGWELIDYQRGSHPYLAVLRVH